MFNTITQEANGDSCLIGYYPGLFSDNFIKMTKDYCYSQTDWLGGMSSFGKAIPRLQKWYQLEGKYFSPAWRECHPRWEAFPYDNKLLEIQEKVKMETEHLLSPFKRHPNYQNTSFNSCLVNYYRDEQDSIKPHSDSIDVFGSNPTIAILSIGETREIFFKRKKIKDKGKSSLRLDKKHQQLNSKIKLEEGSLLIMAGGTQRYYLHEIPKVDDKKKERYSLTFRNHIT